MTWALQQLEALGYQFEVDDERIKLHYAVDGDPDPAQVKPLLAVLRDHKSAALDCIRRRSEAQAFFQRAIQAARDWADLGRVTAALDEAYSNGQLSLSQVEALATWAGQRSRQLAEKGDASAGLIIWSERLTTPVAGECPNCDQADWWDCGGRRVCRVCHPSPNQANLDPAERAT